MTVSEQKSQIRKAKILERNNLSADKHTELSEIIYKNLIPLVPENSNIALYYPTQNEVNVINLFDKFDNICLPVIAKNSKIMAFHKYLLNKLSRNKFGILEPDETCEEISPEIIIVPIVAFDRFGYRIGYGGGYYDATINNLQQNKKILTIGVAFSFQEVDLIPTEAHDKKLDLIITEEKMFE
ncbi:MAG: 5-formyltetrahydrofolate cyclo-ligase [Pseudomonadota bacterium]